MTRLLLVRHGCCEGLGVRLNGRSDGVRLSSEGRGEVARLATRISTETPRLVMTSPRERCRVTADAISTEARASVEVSEDLDEVDFGAWTGLSFERLADDLGWREWNERRSVARAPAGESMADVQRRMRRALKAAEARARGGVVVLVSHAEPIRAALADILGFSLDAWSRLDVSPAGVTRLAVDAEGLRVCSVNETYG